MLTVDHSDEAELKDKKVEVRKFTDKIGVLEDKAMKLMKTNISLKEEHVGF